MDQKRGHPSQGKSAPVKDYVVVKVELPWSVKEESQDDSSAVCSKEQPSAAYSPVQPSAVCSTAQAMSDSTSGSALWNHVCPHCSAVFMLPSSLQVHLETFHGKTQQPESPGTWPLPDRDSQHSEQTASGQEGLPTAGADDSGEDSVTSSGDSASEDQTNNMDIDEDDRPALQGESKEWVRHIPARFPRVPEFTEQVGIQPDLGTDPQPIDVFQLFVDDALIKKIKQETNRYAQSCIEEQLRMGALTAESVYASWEEVTKADINNFLAICLHMGLVHKPQIADYWSTDPTLHTAYAGQIMTPDRFMAILGFLHINDNAHFVPFGQENHDPIHKIRPLVDHLQKKFQEVYKPGKEICIREAVCPFRGRSRFKVYMKDKPTKRGFKFYELCESKSGYVYRFEMFCGDKRLSNEPHDVVTRLLAPMVTKGHHVYMDNYYCEPGICSALARQGTMVCGTVQRNRAGMPPDLANQHLERGQMDFRCRGQVVATRWKDERDVFTLSTLHRPQLQRVQCQFGEKQKPKAVIDYIRHMAGVDHSESLLAFCPMHRKSLKWWKKPFFHLLTLCTIQTMTILNEHRKSHGRKEMPLDHVMRSLLMDLPTAKDIKVPTHAGDGPRLPLTRMSGRHFPALLPSTGRNEAPRKNCVVCYAKRRSSGIPRDQLKKTVKRSKYWCPDCEKGLCAAPCFFEFHTKKHYMAV